MTYQDNKAFSATFMNDGALRIPICAMPIEQPHHQEQDFF